MARLRVLYLTHHGPWPTSSGGRLRDAALLPELARLADVEVWAISRSPDVDRAAVSQCQLGIPVRVFDDDGPARSYPSRHSNVAKAALRDGRTCVDRFDVIHVEGHYLFHHLPNHVRERAVVVEHNIESHLLRQRAQHHGLTPELAGDIETVTRAEQNVWSSAALIITLSAEDRVRVLRRVPNAAVGVSTDGADHVGLTHASSQARDEVGCAPTFGFLANYAYPPNEDALEWLLDEIFPSLRERIPGCRLVLAGSNLETTRSRRQMPDGAEPLGWVDDLSTFWADIDVFLCPLRISGGVKVKLLESIRSATLAVSTTVGVEGLPTAAQCAIVCADDTRQFVEAAAVLSHDDALRQRQRALLDRAQQSLSSWKAVARSLHAHWLSVARPVVGGFASE